MNNFQLYRTNVLLGGQVKLDLVIDSFENELLISDFNLSPISPNISEIHDFNEYIIKNSHQDNIKKFYNLYKGEFYSESLNQNFYSNWPTICDEGELIDAYSNIYDRGCKRANSFYKYNKQFEFLCPLWLEHLDLNEKDLSFVISVKYVNSDEVLSSKKLSFLHSDSEYHKNVIKYFKEYIEYAGISSGNDNVINVVFKENTANITGLNVSSGIFETKPIISLINNLTNRERTLLETDGIITNSFKDNSMICSQLFNFNLCFNVEDILTKKILDNIISHEIKISVDAYIGDELLEKKDFYTEYDFIDRKIHNIDNRKYKDRNNVLDYLYDFNNIDLLNVNKYCKSICHWSLYNNNDYIFNVYDGFSGLYHDGDKLFENSHQYELTPDISNDQYNRTQNNVGWINTYAISNWLNFNKYVELSDTNKKFGSFIDNKNTNFINGLQYKAIPDDLNGLYLIGMIVENTLMSTIKSYFANNSDFECIYDDNSSTRSILYVLKQDKDFICFITNDKDNMTFKKFKRILEENTDNVENEDIKHYLSKIKELMTQIIDPTFIQINSSVKYAFADSPSNDTREIVYFKDNTAHNYVFRYDGKIKPTFVDNTSTLYYKDYVSDSKDNSKFKDTVYRNYVITGYEPSYPSIYYCVIKKLTADDWRYDKLPKINVSEFSEEVSICNDIEYTWFDDNKYMLLYSELSFEYINKKSEGLKTMNEIIDICISKYYNTEDKEKIKHIRSLYEFKNSWDYFSETNIDDYIYNINLKLK